MKVRELISILRLQNQDAEVITQPSMLPELVIGVKTGYVTRDEILGEILEYERNKEDSSAVIVLTTE